SATKSLAGPEPGENLRLRFGERPGAGPLEERSMASEAIAQAPHGAAVGSMGEAAAAAAEHGGAFPPFDPTFFPSQLLWLAVTFGALYWLSSRVLLPRLSGIIEDRRDRIADDLAEAE